MKVLEKKYFSCFFDSASKGKNSVHIPQGGNNATVKKKKKKRKEGSHGHLRVSSECTLKFVSSIFKSREKFNSPRRENMTKPLSHCWYTMDH